MSSRTCCACKEVKPTEQFRIRPNTVGICYFSYCRDCENIRKKAVRANPEYAEKERAKNKIRARTPKVTAQRREWKFNNRYGITTDKYNDMFAEQQGNCAICFRHQSIFTKSLAVDHCHTTGDVRGLLCNFCNSGIGQLQDDPNLLDKAATYLRRPRLKLVESSNG